MKRLGPAVVYSLITLYVVLVVAILIGWIKNIVWLFTGLSFADGVDGIEILSLLGVPLGPLGAVMGWLH